MKVHCGGFVLPTTSRRPVSYTHLDVYKRQVLSYGIPEFRLPKSLVQKEVDSVASLGVKFETNVVVGRSVTIDELQEQGYQGIFIGSGAGLPRFQNIPGENLNGVYAANESVSYTHLLIDLRFHKKFHHKSF